MKRRQEAAEEDERQRLAAEENAKRSAEAEAEAIRKAEAAARDQADAGSPSREEAGKFHAIIDTMCFLFPSLELTLFMLNDNPPLTFSYTLPKNTFPISFNY